MEKLPNTMKTDQGYRLVKRVAVAALALTAGLVGLGQVTSPAHAAATPGPVSTGMGFNELPGPWIGPGRFPTPCMVQAGGPFTGFGSGCPIGPVNDPTLNQPAAPVPQLGLYGVRVYPTGAYVPNIPDLGDYAEFGYDILTKKYGVFPTIFHAFGNLFGGDGQPLGGPTGTILGFGS